MLDCAYGSADVPPRPSLEENDALFRGVGIAAVLAKMDTVLSGGLSLASGAVMHSRQRLR